MESGSEELGVRHWGRQVWRRKWVLLAIVVVFPVAVFAASNLLPKKYEAAATVNVKETALPATVFSNQITSGSNIAEVRTLIQTSLVARRAARLLGEPPSQARSLLDQVSVDATSPAEAIESGEGRGSFLTITAVDEDPVQAAAIANAFARATAQVRTSNAVDDIDGMLRRLESEGFGAGSGRISREALAQQLQQLRGLRVGQEGTTPLVEPAIAPAEPSSPQPLRNAMVALLLALVAAAALAPLLDRLDRRLREPEELASLLDAPLLATIPDDAFPGHLPGPHVMEAFETLRSSLTYFNVDRPLSTLVVASAAQQDGKTTVAVNLAVAFARDGRDVILLDGDLRFPQVASRLGREVTAGLDTVLVGESSLEEALIDVDAGGGRLRILPGAGGAPNPAVLLGSQRMRTLLAELEEISDIIVIDSPAILAVSDAMPLINAAAGTILVARVDKTQKEAVERMAQLASSAGGVVLGSVATGGRGGGVYGYYGYYRDGNNGHAQKPKPPVGTGLRDGVNGSENGSKVGVNPPPGS